MAILEEQPDTGARNTRPVALPIGHVRQREQPSARHQNRLIDAVNVLQARFALPRQFRRPMRDAYTAEAPSVVQCFKLVSGNVYADYVVCQTWDYDTLGGTDIAVAKPWALQQTPWDGETHNGITYDYTGPTLRTATKDSIEEDQVIVPEYVSGDIIYAIRNPGGGTGVDNVEWLDLNQSARAWAELNSEEA